MKVVRPGIEAVIAADMQLLTGVARWLDENVDIVRPLHLPDIVADYETTIFDELDMRKEAANTERLRENFAGSELLYVPRVHHPLSRRNVLVLERIYGVPIADLETLKRPRHQHEEAGRARRGDLLHPGVRAQLLPRRHAPGQHLRRRGGSGRSLLHRHRLRHHRPALPGGSGLPGERTCSPSSIGTTGRWPDCISNPAGFPRARTRTRSSA